MFWKIRVQGHPSWVPLVQSPSWSSSQAIRARPHLKAPSCRCFGSGKESGFQVHPHDCWQTSVPHTVGLSPWQLHSMTAGSPQGEPSRDREADRKPWSCYNLVWEVPSHPFCGILLTGTKSLGLAHTPWKEITEGHEYQEAESIMYHLGGCSLLELMYIKYFLSGNYCDHYP